MAILGTLLKNRRAGQTRLAWNLPALAGPDTLALRTSAFAHEGTIPRVHVGKRVGGRNTSPDLAWNPAPQGTSQLLLIIEDADFPGRSPFVHGAAVIAPSVLSLAAGALDARDCPEGVRVLRSSLKHGYMGPEPIKGHGPHRYVFQLFALSKPVISAAAGTPLEKARPRDVIASVSGPVLGRSRVDGFYTR